MAPKPITRDRVVRAASQSAAKVRAEVRAALVEHLGCEYLDDAGGALRKATELKFRWSFRGSGDDETEKRTGRWNNVLERGVPIPDAWGTALRCLSLDEVATTSTDKIREKEPGLKYVECCVLGRAKAPTDSDVGKLVALSSNGARVSYFKCARISVDTWLAHAGTYKESGLLDAENRSMKRI